MTLQNNSLGSKVIRGTFWTIGMRWLSRVIGVSSMVIVARLLTPADFGIIGVTTALIGLMETFTELGVDTALIRHPNPKRKHFDTAWTFTILVHLFSASLIALTGYFSYYFYSDPRYEEVLYVMSLSMLFSGFSNIGFVNFRRNFAYQKDFQFNVSKQVIGVISTLAFAFWLKSYWALVFGGLARSIVGVILSYAMHPYRPRLSLSAAQELSNFSIWILIRSVAIFLTNKADRLVLAAYFNPTILGYYTIAGELASMSVFELLNPLGRVIFPAFASKQNDRIWLEENLKKTVNVTATLAVASGLGVATLAEPLLTLIYGNQYVEAAPILLLLSILNAFWGLNQPISQFLILVNRVRDYSLLSLLEGIATLTTVYVLATNNYDLMTIIYGRLLVSIVTLLRLFYLLTIFDSINLITILSAWIRPLFAGLVMFKFLEYLKPTLTSFTPAILILTFIVIGAFIYISVLITMWVIMRKPDGIESEIIKRIFISNNKFKK